MAGDDTTREQELHRTVIAHLDESGGEVAALYEALDAANVHGYDTEPIREKAESLNGDLQEAFNEADSADPDPSLVADRARSATTVAQSIHESLTADMAAFTLPPGVDSGVHDTLGAYVRYVERSTIGVKERAIMWAYEAT